MLPRLLFTLGLLASPALAAAQTLEVRGATLVNMHGGRDGTNDDRLDATRKQLDELAAMGANWIVLTEHVYMEDVRQPEVRWRAGGSDRMRQTIADAHARGLKVLLKPHIWSRQFAHHAGGGDWHGTVAMTSEEDWQAFFKNYGDYIVEHAAFAAEVGADSVSIGTELKATTHRETEWRALVGRVRGVYDGALTYSACSDEWQGIQWWDAVDCVGITAYFKLADNALASDAELRQGWQRIYSELKPFAQKVGRPVCFTELGYSRSANAASAPWEYGEVDPDPAFQARLYRVAIEEAQQSGVVSGTLLWKWFTGEADQVRQFERGEAFIVQDNTQAVDAIRQAWLGTAEVEPVN